MKQVLARRYFVLLHDDGVIHYPFSRFLTDRFTNPDTRGLVANSLRVFYRFCTAHHIELTFRAMHGQCLTYDETKKLAELCYRPLREVEAMGERKVLFLTSASARRPPNELRGAVEPNTARKRLTHISDYLDFYREVFLEPNIRSSEIRDQLKYEYDRTINQLRKTIRGTKQSHHLGIKSLPKDKYLSLIEAVFLRPQDLFQTAAGKPVRTLLRDRAMTLLACEGLRSGTLGNIAIADFRPASKILVIKDNRANRTERITTKTPRLKLGDSTKVNSASETMITLWPFTVRAIQDYIDTERSKVLEKRLINRSNGFLFLNNEGKPIQHRATITKMFNGLGRRLAALGLLRIGDDPYFENKKNYDFYGYVLRHSAASFFLSQKSIEHAERNGTRRPHEFKDVPETVKDLLRLRFGWVSGSNMPERYAARALSDNASVVLMEFNQKLLDAATELKKKRESQHDL